ncbi:Lysosomal-associated transmembrane protein 4B [Pseudolycoriella hygida]|uniref:Lysosomal-associated transmembrane protein 4B n=1 Tax=Pseudolycoriella hygida TaxID=35572 RepID=A0A9Q0SA63_9DIPT|nr:Lysosomal-associated transmembrane protein 4B [Pseudolycoriella hygida]
MFRIGIKMGPARNKEWTCMFGMHVRTATIIIGLWHLLLNILVLGLLAVIIRNPEMIRNLEHDGYDDNSVDMDAPILPTPLSKIEPPYAYRDHSLNYQNIDMGGLVCVCMIGITLLMIYGAVKGKPSHLLPYFCVQLFDFAITTLTAAGYLCYLRSVHRLIHESHRLPWREELLKMSPQALSIVVLLAFVSVVMFKAYVIGIIWRCYKYLAIRQHNLRSMLPYIIPDVSARQERDYTTLLPDYDEAIAQSLKQQPPPSYQVAMASTTQLPENNDSVPNATAENATPAAISSIAAGSVSTAAGTATEVANRSAINVV